MRETDKERDRQRKTEIDGQKGVKYTGMQRKIEGDLFHCGEL